MVQLTFPLHMCFLEAYESFKLWFSQWRRAILSLGAVAPPKTKIRGPGPPPKIEGQGPVVKGRSGQESGERG